MTSPDRIAYLDNLRFALVALVVPLHAYYIGFPDHSWIATLHDSFHMAALFVISGFFAGPAIDRLGGGVFRARRGRALLPPLLVILALSPPTYAMHLVLKAGGTDGYWAALGDIMRTGHILLHGWFLAALLIYVILAGTLLRLIRSDFAARWAARVPAPWRGVALVILATFTAYPAEALWSGTDGPLGLPLFFYETLRYLWAFCLGLAAWQVPALFQALHRPDPRVALLAVIAWGLTLGPVSLSTAGWEAAWALRRVASAMILIPICFWAFKRFANVETPATRALSDAGMTVFVTQWALLYIFALTLPLGFWGLSALTLIAGVALHHGVVKRSPVALEWVAGTARPATGT